MRVVIIVVTVELSSSYIVSLANFIKILVRTSLDCSEF